MKRKKGLTLVELMVTLSIFLLLSLMISAMLIQSQKILIRTEQRSGIQNEIRTALLKMQKDSEEYDKVEVINKFGSFNGDKWETLEGETSARELLRFSNENENTAKVYSEVYENNSHRLIEFIIDKSTNQIIDNTKDTLISNIEGNDVQKIEVYTDDKLVTINCSSLVNVNTKNETEYVISFPKENKNEINIAFGGSNNQGSSIENDNKNDNNDNGNLNGSGSDNENNNGSSNSTEIDKNIPEWESGETYYKGAIVKYNNVIYKLSWEQNIGNNPEYGNAWTIISEEPTVWKRTKDYEGSQKVTHNGKTYIAQWYANAGLEPGIEYVDVWKLID